MPMYDVTIRKEWSAIAGISPWSNVYHVSAADEEAALDVGNAIAVIEMAVSYDVVLATRLQARQSSVLSGSGRQRAISIAGARDSSGKQFLPLFNTVRVTFTDGIARPDQKYLRLPIAEDEQDTGGLDPGLVTMLEDDYVDPIIALAGVVSSDDAPYTIGTVLPFVQMRQRNWSRRARPGFHRGYVPD